MKFKKGNWRIDSKTLIRLEWDNCIPKLIIHEKYENIVKRILRTLSIIGIATAFITLPYVTGIIVTLSICIIEQFFERTVFEYSIAYLFPLPDFEIQYDQWKTSGYFIINNKALLNEGHSNHFGPAYEDKDYAIKFFNYLREWNDDENVDDENNICVSLIIESETRYTTYFYPNSNKKELEGYFSKYKEKMALEKYGKRQQQMIFQMIFWKPNQQQGPFFKEFISDLNISTEFFFVPFYLSNGSPVIIEELKVLKNNIKVKKRSEVTVTEIEYHYK